MTRILAILSCLLLALCLCFGVSAANEVRATSMNLFVTVSDDGSSQITSTVTLHVETPQEDIHYPVPANATNITLNGSRVITQKSGQLRLVNLSKTLGGMAGDFSFTVSYNVPSTVKESAVETTAPSTSETGEVLPAPKIMEMSLPLLSGFAYPIEQLQFSINLPGLVTQNPSFVSGYHQANIEKDLTYSISGGNIAGRAWTELKDRETLTMYLQATDEMFPQTRVALPPVDTVKVLIGVLAGVALVYWLLMLRNFLPIRSYPAVAPEGVGAGQLGRVLTMSGSDLGLMLFGWAQLGYVVLRMDRRGRVQVYKRMDMGNERSNFEQKCFYKVFSRRDMVDTSTVAFQRLHQAVAVQKCLTGFFRTKNRFGIRIFRLLTSATGLFCGTFFGIVLGNMLDFGWLFMLVLSAIGFICSWHIQYWPQGVFQPQPMRLWIALGLSVLWLALGIAIKQFPMALLSVLIQLLAGLMAAFGGRRTEDGRMAMGQILSLRRYLTHLSRDQIQKLCRNNPEFFFDMAPEAIALGCDAAFARQFGKSRLPVCPYIQTSDARGLTATQWSQLMRQILVGITARQRYLPLENLRAVMGNYMK